MARALSIARRGSSGNQSSAAGTGTFTGADLTKC
jgi:hypothetical protein